MPPGSRGNAMSVKLPVLQQNAKIVLQNMQRDQE